MLQPWWTISFKFFFSNFPDFLKGLNSEIMWKSHDILPSPVVLGKDFAPPWCFQAFFGELLRCHRLEMASRSGSQKSKSGAMQKELSKARSCFTWEITWEISLFTWKMAFQSKEAWELKGYFFWFPVKPPFRWMNLEVLKPPLMARLIVFQKLQALQPIVPRLQWLQISGFIQTEDEKSLLTSKRNKCPNLGRTCKIRLEKNNDI